MDAEIVEEDPFPGLGEPYGYVKPHRFSRKFANKMERNEGRETALEDPELPFGGPTKEKISRFPKEEDWPGKD